MQQSAPQVKQYPSMIGYDSRNKNVQMHWDEECEYYCIYLDGEFETTADNDADAIEAINRLNNELKDNKLYGCQMSKLAGLIEHLNKDNIRDSLYSIINDYHELANRYVKRIVREAISLLRYLGAPGLSENLVTSQRNMLKELARLQRTHKLLGN